uniref:Phenoloxidase-activating factor 2 n=1 Tax=Dendroctonus ponderosae TaxID=77166 RepID=A0AAR5PZF9_DENPD
MRLLPAHWALLLLAACAAAQDNSWSWNQPSGSASPDVGQKIETGYDLEPAATANAPQNATDMEKVIDEILGSQRQGRALQGYDEVYSDPNVQEALQKGDDGEARNVIKDRLCYLGLMQCEEEIEGKRPFISPEELIYAQPVAINPVGRPIPTIPVKGGRGGYGPGGPQKFGPPPSGKYPPFSPNKPPRRGYGPAFAGNGLGGIKPPHYGGISKPPFLAGGEILAEGEFLNRPPTSEYFNKGPGLSVPGSPYQFESVGHTGGHKDKRVEITVNAQGGAASATVASANKGQVEHVHHHYHHNADGIGNTPTVVVNPGPLAAAAVSSLSQSSSSFGSSSLSSNGFIPVGASQLPLESSSQFNGLSGASYGGQNIANYGSSGLNYADSKPISESFGPQTFGSGSTGLGSFGSSSSSFNSNGFGASGGYYGSNNLYKKELNVDSVNNNYLGSNYADKYKGVESARAESYDCVCVPYDQCPTHDVIGRKDDLYLAIDPRNLKSDIEAETDKAETRVLTDGNGTMTIVRVPKDTSKSNETETAEEKKVSKREAPAEKKEGNQEEDHKIEGRQAYYGRPQTCGPRHVCCRRPFQPPAPTVNRNTCGTRHSQGINGRIKNPVYVDGDSEFGEYPWQVAILKKDPKESVYVCGGTLIDPLHILTAAHCVKQYTNFDLRVRLGEWDVNHDVEFYPYIERDIASLTVHPEFYAGTLANDIAVLRMSTPVDWTKHPHISPACLPHPQDDYTGARCWTTGWGKDAFGDFGKYQNILKEVDVPVVGFGQCQRQLQNTRLGYEFKLHPGFVCAGGEEGKDACKGDGGGPMVCERGGTWQLVGVVSWGIGCGQIGVPGVYVRVAHYLDWIRQVTQRY